MCLSIAFATDLSARSYRPLDRAVQLGEQFGAKLIIIHALELQKNVDPQAQKAEAVKKMLEITANISIPFRFVLEYGSAPELIAEVAAERGSAFIVVGPARYNDVCDFVLGTAVDYLLRYATVPVLLVKEKPVAEYDGLVVGTDFSKQSMDALHSALTLFEGIPAMVVHGYEPPFLAHGGSDDLLESAMKWESEKMAEFLGHPGLAQFRWRVEGVCVESRPADAIETASEKFRNPLAVLGAQHRGRLTQAVLGSRVAELLATISRDILIVREDSQRVSSDHTRVQR